MPNWRDGLADEEIRQRQEGPLADVWRGIDRLDEKLDRLDERLGIVPERPQLTLLEGGGDRVA